MKILLVEDDEPARLMLSDALIAHRYIIDVAKDGQTGLAMATSFSYDLIILDLLIPKLDGISLCHKLRSQGYQKPILLLTAKDSNTDIVNGLDAGADDYIVKPYNILELMARIRALLRRKTSTVTPVLTWGDLHMNPVMCEVTYKEQPLSLTPKEYSLLELFLQHPQRVFSRSAILDLVWSLDYSPTEHAVTTHIKDLRHKLKAAGLTTDIIETLYGLGYRLKSPPEKDKRAGGRREKGGAGERGTEEDNLTPNSSTTAAIQTAKSKSQLPGIASVNKVLEKFKNTFVGQVAVLEQAMKALQVGSLSSDAQQNAKQEAHKLAGSLGTFGYPQGSKLAREAEYLLMGDIILGQEEASLLEQLVAALQYELTKPPVELTPAPSPIVRDPLVLAIADDLVLTERLKVEAVVWGMQIAIAPVLTAARHKISQTPPDAILLDLTFPTPAENGLALLRELAEQFPTIPILTLTARDSLADRVEISRLGGRGFLHKPVSTEQIFKAIERVLPPTQTPEAKVMLVDDDPAALGAIAHLLQPWGLQVTSLTDPRSFWEVLTATAPDLLVLDLEMPAFSGIDLCRVVRQDPQWGDLPLLVVTAHTDPESLQQVFAAGADDFIGKPVIGPELVTRIMSRIERVRLWQKLQEIKRRTLESK